jgi:hypothetical protein
MTASWRISAQSAAGNEDDAAKPVWADGIPLCDGSCPLYDGKRCAATGFRPRGICEPVVAQMSRMLTEGPK